MLANKIMYGHVSLLNEKRIDVINSGIKDNKFL